jgi:diguanylate cyclase (GGDEF)-like protein
MMVSIKKFLERQGDKTADVDQHADNLLRMVHMLLNGTALHAVELDEAEYVEYRDDILHLDEQLGQAPSTADAMVVAGAALKRMEDYGRRVTKIVKMQSGELQRMVAMLADTVGTLAAGNDTSINNLQAISKRIERTKEIEDLRVIKAKLADCLDSLQQETIRRRSESAAMVSKMKEELVRSRERLDEDKPNSGSRDDLTGFPDRVRAEELFANALQTNPNLFVAVFVVQRVQLINARFGYTAGDQVINHFGTHLLQSLPAADMVFRWGGPCFVAAIERSHGMNEIRAELANVSNSRLEKTIRAGTRVAMLPIASLWSVFSIRDLRTVEEIRRKVEQFATLSVPGTPQS